MGDQAGCSAGGKGKMREGRPLEQPHHAACLHPCTPSHTPAPGQEELCQTQAFWVSPRGLCTKTKPSTRWEKKKIEKENEKKPSHTQQKVLASHLHSHVLTVPQRLLRQPQMPQPVDGSSSPKETCAASHPMVPGGTSLCAALPRPTPLCRADPRRSQCLPANAKSQRSLTSPRCLTTETCRGRFQPHRH